MESNKTALAWLVAVVFIGTTALFAWQYVRARNDAAKLRTDYESLQLRLEEQEVRNGKILEDVQRMQEQLGIAADQIESLQQQIESLQ
jgi:uncharacterized protein HemX